jgi:endoglucanase Acf2
MGYDSSFESLEMTEIFKSLCLVALGLLVSSASMAQSTMSFGAGQVLLAPRTADNAAPKAIGLADSMKGQAVPTNQWYSGLVFSPKAEVLFAQPYSVRAAATGFELALPKRQVISTERKDTEIHYPHRAPLVITPLDFKASQGKLAKASDWAIDISMGAGADRFDFTVAHGSPYIYGRISRGSVSFQTSAAAQRTQLSSDQRVLTLLSEGQTYAIFGPSGVRWEQLGQQWVAHLPMGKGYFSAAVLPDNSSETLALFMRHAHAHITQTQVSWHYNETNNSLRTDYSVTTQAMEGTETQTLMGLYPHHWHQNQSVNGKLKGQYETIRGAIRLLPANQFSTELTYRGFVPFWPGLKDHPRNDDLKAVLKADVSNARRNMLQIGNGPYWQGKGLQRISKVLDVAEQQGDTEAAKRLQNLLKGRIEQWFSGKDRQTYFHLDKTLGTVLAYPEEYFAVEQMNDHHFHYGYWIRTMADLALRDPEWASDTQWGAMTNLLIQDIATAERGKKEFPFLRTFDIYEGHSWASGIGLGDLGNNQESSSEAINAWSALILWAEIRGDKALRDLGIYLYTTEIEAIRHYWFDVYNLVFAPEYKNKEVSMLFGGAYKHNTWWTDEPRQIKGINLLPISTSSTYLGLDPAHTKRSLATLPEDTRIYESRGKRANPTDMWQDLFAKYMALTDPAEGLKMWNRWGAVELGDTRTHALHFMLSLEKMGPPDFSVTADHVLHSVFKRSDGLRTYLAYNTGSQAKTVTFSDGQLLQVPPRSLAQASKKVPP